MKHIGLVVEGRADKSLAELIRRYLAERGHTGVLVGRPITPKDRGKLLKRGELEKFVYLAATVEGAAAVIVVFDSDKDPACQLGPEALARVPAYIQVPVKMCLAVRNVENWIVASAETTLGPEHEPLADPEGTGAVHAVKIALKPSGYNKSVAQPSLTAKIDFELARSRSPSFDRFLNIVDEMAEACALP